VFQNYFEACCSRFRLWLGNDAVVEEQSPHELRIHHADKVVILGFIPHSCRWWLEVEGERVWGNFDKLTKQARRVLTLRR
jgi:hypothetical protein